jgi:periplasmic copper chaperone A
MKRRFSAWAAILCVVAACTTAGQPPLVASAVRVVEPRPGTTTGAAYLTLRNPGDAPVTVTAVTSPQYDAVHLHESVADDGVARMRPLPSLLIAPGAAERLEPGSKHLMLVGRRDDGLPVTLQFWSGATLLLAVEAPAGEGD